MSVGMPEYIYLEQFGILIRANFHEVPYLVGSVLKKKAGWRDIDVRLLLDDKDWKSRGYGDPESPSATWGRDCAFYAEIGQKMTRLPIDFQIQETELANKMYGDFSRTPRSALGVMWSGDRMTHPKTRNGLLIHILVDLNILHEDYPVTTEEKQKILKAQSILEEVNIEWGD